MIELGKFEDNVAIEKIFPSFGDSRFPLNDILYMLNIFLLQLLNLPIINESEI